MDTSTNPQDDMNTLTKPQDVHEEPPTASASWSEEDIKKYKYYYWCDINPDKAYTSFPTAEELEEIPERTVFAIGRPCTDEEMERYEHRDEIIKDLEYALSQPLPGDEDADLGAYPWPERMEYVPGQLWEQHHDLEKGAYFITPFFYMALDLIDFRTVLFRYIHGTNSTYTR